MIEYIKKLGYETVNSDFYTFVDDWLNWYQGKIEKFHKYYQYNGKKRIKRERASLGMPKKICEDWANLLLNEKAEITTENERYTEKIKEVLVRNNFRVRGNQLIELAFALGTGAFVEYLEEKNVCIDYVRANMIYPLSWDNGEIIECAFASEKIIDKKRCVYLQLHVLENGKYVIKNRLFEKEGKKEIPLPPNIKPDYNTGSSTPLYQIVKPNIINNVDLDNPMGISVYANAIDVLKGVDLVYDSYQNEFRLGKKRIIVPAGMAQRISNGDTQLPPVFDDNDTEFYAFPDNDFTDIKEINMEIRSSDHTEGLQQNLNLLSDKCGLGTNRYSYQSGGIKTATEVISENSALYQNLCKHQILIRTALQNMAKAILFLSGYKENVLTDVDFDDSIIEDRDLEFNQNMQMVSAGLMLPWEFRMWKYNETEEQAKSKILTDSQGDE